VGHSRHRLAQSTASAQIAVIARAVADQDSNIRISPMALSNVSDYNYYDNNKHLCYMATAINKIKEENQSLLTPTYQATMKKR